MINEKLEYQRAIDKARKDLFYAEMSDSIGGHKAINEADNRLRRLKKEYNELYGEDYESK